MLEFPLVVRDRSDDGLTAGVFDRPTCVGLDLRIKDAGTYRGRRKVSKRDNPEMRRLLHSAAITASRYGHGKHLYERYRTRGLSPEALVILTRKIARIAFALMKNQSDYQPPKCTSTA